MLKTIKHWLKKLKSKWRSILCSWIGRLNIVKMSVLPKTIYRFNTFPIKTSAEFFEDIDKLILNCIHILVYVYNYVHIYIYI